MKTVALQMAFVRRVWWVVLILAIGLAAPRAPAQSTVCPETNGVKFLLLPKTDGGLDVFDSAGIVLADDFLCTTPGPITDIHIWGSWLNDQVGIITNFWLGIYDDVPATLIGTTQIPSHPGTNLLWEQSFDQTQFSQTPYANGTEYFFDPRNTNIMGGDKVAWYYCFFPTVPFVQQGTPNNPTNYWLAVHAQLSDPTQLFGWKSAVTPYNDAAVWAPAAGMKPAPNSVWTSMGNPFQGPMDLAFKITTATNGPTPPCCPETNGVKWAQPPHVPGGVDVQASINTTVADDFGCTTTGPITDIHLWGAWLNDQVDPAAIFSLTIWSDVPAAPGNTFSHPGQSLWSQAFGPGAYTMCPYTNGQESFLAPNAAGLSQLGFSTNLYYFCFFPDPAKLFTQTGTAAAPTNYWLSVNVQSPTGGQIFFGWKSSDTSYNDAAVWGTGLVPPAGSWQPMVDPSRQGNKMNMAFKITTATNQPPPPAVCLETNGVKYIQPPNLDGGFDVWNSSTRPTQVTDGPWVIADDFLCTNTGPVTDIHLWGSWLNDLPLTNSITFWIGIYDDVPADPVNNFSHPGNLLWQQWFAPGQYAESLWSPNAIETFLDPGLPAGLGPERQAWYYCFNPINPPIQQGSTSAPKLYWLSVFAQLPAGTPNVFGWKSSFTRLYDTSVHGLWPGFAPTNNPGWKPTVTPTGVPLDLAFKLTTVTNNCPLNVACPPDKTVECGSSWAFDPPTANPSQCCTVLPTITLLSVTTNAFGPCQEILSAAWKISDCVGNTAYCTQAVTVVDTTPPVIACANNKTVECGTTWGFDKPIARDACCGTNVTIKLVNVLTNIPGPCQSILTAVWEATDCCTNSSRCTQTVTVVDTVPPAITCPSNIVVKTCNTNAQVFWTITASDACSSVTVTSSPPSGTFFLPNTTNTVVGTATDACGNMSRCAFTVAIVRPALGSLTITYSPPNIVLTWTDGILQQADNVIGPWSDTLGASPPSYTVAASAAARFYRLRCNSP